MLKAYGVGDEKATVLAATFTWLLKGIYIDLFQFIQDNFSPYRTNFKWEMQPEREVSLRRCFYHDFFLDGAGMVGRILFTWLKGFVNNITMISRKPDAIYVKTVLCIIVTPCKHRLAFNPFP